MEKIVVTSTEEPKVIVVHRLGIFDFLWRVILLVTSLGLVYVLSWMFWGY